MGDDFRVGFGFKARLRALQLFLERRIIFNDAVMDDGDAVGGVRVGVVLGRAAMGRPACMADANGAFERLGFEFILEIDQLALRAATLNRAIIQRRNSGAVIAAIFPDASTPREAGGLRPVHQVCL